MTFVAFSVKHTVDMISFIAKFVKGFLKLVVDFVPKIVPVGVHYCVGKLA